ncbi:hypothetical protein [Streptacidiphilus jiangxiensis]|uniref:Uncharacterized protein n=1 Tax=Streptacidiphilus jiangxiensis TaxID=235985 RepID=A0A1H7MWC4_STRJI|nr:hypothetical protein [Streptacidiphilus jiangxiensis]SEL15590.1 hypothetical protein SAMN05414137_106103 [Streptacidiphilus jiangxiensis]
MRMRMRRVVAVRAVTLALGLTAVVGAALASVGPYQDTMAFHHAQPCPEGGSPRTTAATAELDCIASESGSVTGRHTNSETNADEGSSSTITHYLVQVRRSSGARDDEEVGASVYAVAQPGAAVQLRTWHGVVVQLAVGGWTESFDPAQEHQLGYTAMAAWTGLGLLLWFLIGNGSLRQLLGFVGLRAFGWLHFGVWTIYLVYSLLAGGRSTADEALLGAVWLLMAAASVVCVRLGWHAHGDEPSLARIARRRRRDGGSAP